MMAKNLRKKLLRDLRHSAVQFTAIFILCFLAMFINISFESDIAGGGNSIDEFFTDTNYSDLSITSNSFTSGDLESIKNLPCVNDAEFRYTVNGKVKFDGYEKKIEFNFLESNNITKMFLIDGSPYREGMSGIWIDSNFARKEKISVGDVLSLEYDNTTFSEEVMGIMDSADHVYFVIDDTFTEPVPGEYGYAFLDNSEYPAGSIVYDTIIADIAGVDNQFYLTDDDKAKISKASNEIKQALSRADAAVTPKQNEIAYEYINDDISAETMLATTFLALFLSIALLGIMTTMTRLVEKQRTLIGTLKALGFSNKKVIIHYTSYSVVVASLGAAAGSIAGWNILGKYLHQITIEYYINPYARMEISPKVLIAIAVIILMAALTNYLSCRKLLVQNATQILKPAPPDAQGAGFIEKTFLWKRMSFASKWNTRDINRNRLRTLAALIGITLCSSLLFTAFGTNELVNNIEFWQYSELTPARNTITFSPGTDRDTVYEYTREFSGQMVMSYGIDFICENGHSMEVITVTDGGNLYNFQDENGNYISLDNNGIAISTKIAEGFDLGVGDYVSFRLPYEAKIYSGRVSMIYIVPSGQGIAMTRSYFESLGTEYRPNVVFTNMTVPSSYVTERDEITSVLGKEAYISSLHKANELTKTEILYVMVIAVIMGIVVMYNLGIMSFIEKVREIATLKVLGFSTKRIRWILQQQNMVITGVGTLVGLMIGMNMLKFMMNNLDDESAYIFNLSPIPYLLAFFISFVLSVIVNGLISKKVKDIDMVEALKGVE